ncbi:MAG TPA: hypothetical protein P5234_01605 [Thermoanaerobaculaceae bacterium]|nr:hypothetical protein [Thermoanaerobaculaceae bacterium]HRS14922.1 hypothetical protein [Thermoanaerobaculaceae bacterium]
MRSRPSAAIWLVLLILLAGMLYPALVLRRVVAPEASLRGQAPWRVQWGPFPAPRPEQVRAATELGARLRLLERGMGEVAVWNPWIGGGRAGWLASPREAGSPLPLLAVALARAGRAWTGLLALQLAVAYLSCAWMLRRLGLGPWPAAIGALAYALAGPVASHWLDWHGSALALGPLIIALVLPSAGSIARSAACWAGALALVGATGSSAVGFAAVALAAATLGEPAGRLPRRLAAAILGALVAAAFLAPRIWLAAVGREEAAPLRAAAVEPPLPGLRALALAPAPVDPAGPAGDQRDTDGRGYLGLATIVLAGLGLGTAPLRQRGLWGGALVVGLALAWAPAAWLERVGITQRPLGVVALAAATLAAFGLERVGRGLEPGRHVLVGAPAAALVLWSLLPVAARQVPFATPEDGELPPPLAAAGSVAEPRVLGLFGCLPPDIGAASGLADVRGAFFEGEPRYAALVDPGPGGVHSASRALTPRIAALGVGTLLEPLPLRVVSGEVFSRIEVAEVPLRAAGDGTFRGSLELPSGTSRIGVPTGAALAGSPTLRSGSRGAELVPDQALAAESNDWRWFALPRLAGGAGLELALAAGGPALVPVAVDRSGLRLASEGSGVRVWSWDAGAPFAALRSPAAGAGGDATPCPGRVEIREAHAERVTVAVHGSGSCSLLVQVKHRPALWQATVDGQRAQTFRCAEVWTCVPVAAGDSLVELRAAVPWPLAALSAAAAIAAAALTWVGRKA